MSSNNDTENKIQGFKVEENVSGAEQEPTILITFTSTQARNDEFDHISLHESFDSIAKVGTDLLVFNASRTSILQLFSRNGAEDLTEPVGTAITAQSGEYMAMQAKA